MNAPELKPVAWRRRAVSLGGIEMWAYSTEKQQDEDFPLYTSSDADRADFALGFAAGIEAAADEAEASSHGGAYVARAIRAIPTPSPLAAALALPEVRALVMASCSFDDAFSNLLNDWGDPYEPKEQYEKGVKRYFKEAWERAKDLRAAIAAIKEPTK